MPAFRIPNLGYIRQDDSKYHAAFTAIQDAITNLSVQGNLDPTGTSSGTPPPVSGLSVVEKDGIHDVQIQDQSPANRGLNYFAYYSRTADFQNEHKVDLGASQNIRVNLGAGQYHWRVNSAYPTSAPSDHVYHPPVGSGTHAGPAMQAGQGESGFGQIYRGSTVPPVRK